MTPKIRKQKIDKASDNLVKWIGSPSSLVVHTIFFIVMLSLAFSNVSFDKVMLVLTTIVSLEAIYLSIFIQMTVNRHADELEEVSDDIEEIQKDVDEIQGDVEGIEENKPKIIFEKIEKNLQDLMKEISELKNSSKD